MFKLGDKVLIKYPERSEWHDTMSNFGKKIKAETVYTIVHIEDHRNFGPSIYLGLEFSERWGLSPECCILATPKRVRNLPEWF